MQDGVVRFTGTRSRTRGLCGRWALPRLLGGSSPGGSRGDTEARDSCMSQPAWLGSDL